MGISKHWYTFIVFNNILKQFFIFETVFYIATTFLRN